MTITLDELRTLPDDAFNRAICAMLGWTLVLTECTTWGFGDRWELVTPDGTPTGQEYSGTYEDAWKSLATPYAGDDYANDLNAAWALCASHTEWFGVDSIGSRGDILAGCGTFPVMEFKKGTQPARALTTAFAAWKLAQEGEA